MNTVTKIAAVAITSSSLLFVGCGEKEPEMTKDDVKKIVEEEAAKSQAQSEKTMTDKLAAGLADMKKESEDALAKAKDEIEANAKAELEAKLAEQKEELVAQFEARNALLRNQYESLKSKFESAKSSLPTEVVEPFMEKLPELATNIDSVESLVSQFSPTTLEQIETFKTKYEKEIGLAKTVADELMKLLANTEVGNALKKIPGL